MVNHQAIAINTLSLPDEIIKWIGHSTIYESSGHSGAKTLYIDRDDGAYLKIAECGTLHRSYVMQNFFYQQKLSAPVINYISADQDYLITTAIKGENGTAKKYISNPKRLSEVFAQSLRFLHDINVTDFPLEDKMTALIKSAETASISQSHLDNISEYIGTVDAKAAGEEIGLKRKLLKNDVLIHGDYCLPNILFDNWKLKGFIDLADSGIGDRHYDLAMGLWTLTHNLKTQKYGHHFLDAYGWDDVDEDRLRICGLLVAIE